MAKANMGSQMLSKIEIASFCGQVAMLLKSGITVYEVLSIIGEDLPAGSGRDIVETASGYVQAGGTFTEGLEATNVFPPYVVNTVRIGEASGRLDECMQSLADYYEKEDALSKNIRSAVSYPLVMVGLMLVVIGVLVVKVLPVFSRVYTQLGAEMSGFAVALLNFGSALGNIALWLLAGVALAVVLYFILRASESGRKTLSRWASKLLFTRKINEKVASGRFASSMAMMLKSGLDSYQALEMVQQLVEGQPLEEKVARCRALTGEGLTLADALAQTEIFNGVNARMVAVGFKTGNVDEVMAKIALRYDDEVDMAISNIISVLEPTLVAVLSIMVGMILLSVMLPLMGVMASIG
ncbi:type II secretion system F family protein [Ruminococcaceae bacterium OttesenSCG-928-N02]|nr:type II secretion system F family protein [Ruminococcaceae bacterium OttesenSCG-928-N02]